MHHQLPHSQVLLGQASNVGHLNFIAGHFTIMSSSNALPLVACRLNTATDKDGTPAQRR